ncbi:hypothetical protein [Janthinobacterium sp. CG3]|uniref:hypothetical protein n=1 Tax=Janthinobacterium sp. CG3 TaxID=1075768 RepID=UPI00034BA07B|nr:hypothetical protein [Janthinobacterium sp. CG3]
MKIDKKPASENSNISTLEDDVVDAVGSTSRDVAAVAGSIHDDAMCGDRLDITMFEQEGEAGSEAVSLGVNGVGYLIPRGMRVSVPVEVVHVLDNAVQRIYEPLKNGEMRPRELKRFNYTVHGPTRA